MLFLDGASALVRLSDCLTLTLRSSADTAEAVLRVYKRNEDAFGQLKKIAEAAMEGPLDAEEYEGELLRVLDRIPEDVALEGALLQKRLHSEVLSVTLISCFCLESYVNSLAYHLLSERDFLGLISSGHKETADVLLEAIDRMSAQSKWETIGRLKDTAGFSRGAPPLQDFKILFRFRDDHVHDKVVDMGKDRGADRYGRKLPDPVFGLLDFTHALYAAEVYWSMITRVHELLQTPPEEFQKHYNLAPWLEEEERQQYRQVADEYRSVFPRRQA